MAEPCFYSATMPKRRRGGIGSLAGFVRTLDSQVVDAPASSEKDDVSEAVAESSSKRQKVGLLGRGSEKYDATTLVPHYTSEEEVPEHLKKCTLNLPSLRPFDLM